jgi:hypothetical protein
VTILTTADGAIQAVSFVERTRQRTGNPQVAATATTASTEKILSIVSNNFSSSVLDIVGGLLGSFSMELKIRGKTKILGPYNPM